MDILTNVERPAEISPEVETMQAELRQTMIPSTMRMKQLLDMAQGA